MWACDIALSALNNLDSALVILKFGTNEHIIWKSQSHPSIFSRRERLRRNVALWSANSGEPLSIMVQDLYKMSDSLLKVVGDFAFPFLFLRHRNGVFPSPLWDDTISANFKLSH
jgi:hypothetical protein